MGGGRNGSEPPRCVDLPLLGLRRAICHTRVLTLQPLEVSW